MKRFVLKKCEEKQDCFITTDQVNKISLRFKNKNFSQSYQFIENFPDTVPGVLKKNKLLEEIKKWLYQNHNDKI